MSDRTARLITISGGAAIAAAAVLTVWLNLEMGGAVYAARLLAGIAGCL